MTQAQTAQQEGAELAFKRFILQQTRGFSSEPQADLYRVNLLGQMLDRYDVLRGKGLDEAAAVARVKREFDDIPARMSEQGFARRQEGEAPAYDDARWPQLTEEEAAQYLTENDRALHSKALGSALCSACVLPLMIGAAFGELLGSWRAEEMLSLLGLGGMFAMIAVGVYACATAKKPKKQEDIRKGRFSLSPGLRRKLTQLREAIDEKARRRRAKGIAILVCCVAPIFLGAALDSLLRLSGACSIFGVAGMFAMIGLGVYEVVMGEGEKKGIKRLLEGGRDK